MSLILHQLTARSIANIYLTWLFRLSKRLSRQGLYEWLSNEFNIIEKNSNVLSIGAGGEINKLLNRYALKNDFRVTSMDIDPQRSPDIEGDVCHHSISTEKYDVILMAEVLEHLHSPPLGLANVHKVLKPEGRLLLSTPFILPIHDAPYDYFRFTKYGLALLLKEYREVNISARNNYFEAIDVLWARLLQTNARGSVILCSVLLPLLFIFKRPLTRIFGCLVNTEAMTTGYVVCAYK